MSPKHLTQLTSLFFTACSLSLAAASCSSKSGPEGGATASSAAVSASAPASASAAPPASASAASSAAADSTASAAAASASAPAASASAAAAPGCPDLSNPDKVFAFGWQSAFQVDAPLAAKLKGVSGAAAETRALANEIDTELKGACTAIAVGLGAKGPFAGADVTCQAAVDALRAARAKLGPAAKIAINAHAPACPASLDAMAECASACGGGDKPEVKCDGGVTSGRCPDTCDGECDFKTPGKCDAACQGRCDAGFSGSCSGTCKGKCNGTALKAGTCAGKCEGVCEGFGRGTCTGICEGGCEGKTKACSGLCVGKCSAAVQDPKCSVTPKVAGLSDECAAYCGTRDVRKSACTPAIVNVTVSGAKDTAAATQYEQAIERNLPAILRIEQKLKDRINTLAKNHAVVSDGLKAITAGGSSALPALNPCLFGAEKTVTEGVALLNDDFRATELAATIARGK